MKVSITSGKRKTAIAKATVRKGQGRIRVNGTPLEIFTPEMAKDRLSEPIVIAGPKAEKIDIDLNVSGGGFMGQAEAGRTAIAKGIVDFLGDKELEEVYKQFDRSLLVSDPRRKMPKKPLGRGARKKRQKSYR
jgi:small subunit ribosomal protein S9